MSTGSNIKSSLADSDSKRNESQGLWGKMREDVACVFERDPSARNRFEVLTTYPGVHAILVYRISNGLWQRAVVNVFCPHVHQY